MGKAKKRVNPKVTSRVDRNLKELTVKTAVKYTRLLPPPWEPNRRGRPQEFNTQTIVVLCLFMVAMNLTYDGMAAEMRNPYLMELLQAKRLPSRSSLQRYMSKLSQKYVRRFNKRLIGKFLRNGVIVIVDSTGIRLKTSSSWYDIRIGRKNQRRDNVKLHLAIFPHRNIILEYKITGYKKHDSPQLDFLLRNIKEVLRVIGDAGYLSRKNCNIVAKKNGQPFFHLKKNTTAKGKGSTAWKKMVRFAKQFKEVFDEIYHIRSLVESVNSALKKRYGNYIRATKRRTRNVQLAFRVVAFNIKQLLYDSTARKLGIPYWVGCDQ